MFLCLCLQGWAAPKTQQQAAQVVAGWLAVTPRPLGAALKTSARQPQAFRSSAGDTLYYVFPLEPAGFVITSADDDIEPIIGFSASGSFDPTEQNPLFALLARDLPERLSHARGGVAIAAAGASTSQTKWASLTSTGPKPKNNGLTAVDDLRVAPFTQSQWNQSTIWNGSASVACYNYYTPPFAAGASSNYVCGCNNTAWAQIMRYYCYPTLSIGTAAFDIAVDGVTVSRTLRGGDGLGGPYQWNLMPLVPGVGTTIPQCQAIGALTADIGTASRTSYAAGGSSAFLANSVLKGTFQYANAIGASGIGAQFSDQVLPNMDARFPVCFSIFGTSGHIIVCDGYGYNLGTLYHHLNLGWGGYENAWYNLPNVTAGGYIFTSLGEFYYNIFTNGNGEIISGRVLDPTSSPIPYPVVQATVGATTYSTQGDSRGIYALAQLPSSTTFSVSVIKKGYQFAPRTVTTGCSQDDIATGNKWGIEIIGTQDQNVRVVTGTISDSTGNGIVGVTVNLSNGGGTVTTDSSGFFFNTVPVGWSGTITPAKARYLFEPAFLVCSNVAANLGNQDFTGSFVIYVNALAGGQNNGSSWTNAFTDLQRALSQAGAGNHIWVAQGIYYPGTDRTNSFQCMPWVSMFGGFSGVEVSRSQRDWNAHPTVLSGDIGVPGDKSDNVYHVVLGASQAVLDGFTVTGGNANRNGVWLDQSGGGIEGSYDTSGFTVANCRVTGNWASSSGGGAYNAIVVDSVICSNTAQYGGGTYGGTSLNCTILGNGANYGGGAYEAYLTSCVVASNVATQGGGGTFGGTNLNCTILGNSASYCGGIYSGTVLDSVICSNAATQNGGGVGYATVMDSIICSNAAQSGGGVSGGTSVRSLVYNNSATICGGGAAWDACLTNCLIASNSATWYGGGAYQVILVSCLITSNSATWYGGGAYGSTNLNCTITGNSANYGGGAYTSTLTNCIVYFNNAATGPNFNGGALSYCCTTPMPAGAGNFTNAPVFISEAGGNLRLQTNSPCINTGANGYVAGSTDLDGRPRIIGGTVDLGAYEFQGAGMGEFIAWLEQYGLPTDGSADFTDPDADGLNNWQEWCCRTDPTNALSVLRLLSASRTQTNVIVTWQSVVGVNYFLEYSTNLSASPCFIPLATNLLGQGVTTSYTHTNAAAFSWLFYRVGVKLNY